MLRQPVPAVACLTFAGAALCVASATAAELFLTGQQLTDTGKRLSVDEVKAIIKPGAKVETYWPATGSGREWTNEPGGTFTAFRHGGARSTNTNGSGEWRFNENGSYCVSIDWKTSKGAPDFTEKWCYTLYKVGEDLYFAPGKLDDRLDKKYPLAKFK